jgi:hypothetical protein
MSEELTCPACDSSNVRTEKNKEKEKLAITGVELVYDKIIHVCRECDARGEFVSDVSEENHEKFIDALKTANTASLDFILKDLSNFTSSMAYLERALELPQRTLSRWKAQGISASGMALMKIVYTYPWILKVADEDFDKQFSKQEVVRQAAEILPSPDHVCISDHPKHIRVSMDWDKRTTEIEGEGLEISTFDESRGKEIEILNERLEVVAG